MAKHHSPRFLALVQEAKKRIRECSVADVKSRLDAGETFELIDVREPHEFQICRIPGSTLIPLGQLPTRVNELPTAAGSPEIIVHCRSGVRSAKAVRLLEERGIASRNLKGGILAWIDRIDPTLPKY